jgi:toxin-antitoxin system PIN domain toxin
MRLADSNIWLALALTKHSFHRPVRDWFARLTPPDAVAFCRATQQSLLRLLTTAAVFAPYGISPLSNKRAWATYETIRADGRVGWAEEPRGMDRQWQKLTNLARPSPRRWMDGYLAAFAIAGGHQLVTTDRVFRQFKGLDVMVLQGG